MSLLLAFALHLIGFAAFGLTGDEHHRRRLGHRPSLARRRQLKWAGGVAVALAFPPAIVARGWIFGPILWFALLMIAAAVIFLALNLTPALHHHHKDIAR